MFVARRSEAVGRGIKTTIVDVGVPHASCRNVLDTNKEFGKLEYSCEAIEA